MGQRPSPGLEYPCLLLERLHEAVEYCQWICICGAVLLVPLRVFIKGWQPFMSRGSHLQYSPCSPFIALVLGGAGAGRYMKQVVFMFLPQLPHLSTPAFIHTMSRSKQFFFGQLKPHP